MEMEVNVKAWLYVRLNHEAKDWPYYKNQRDLQRRSIKSQLQTIKSALACKDAYVTLGKGDNTLHYQPLSEGNLRYGQSTYSGFGEYTAETFKLLGLPVIDMRPADYDALAYAVIRGPMIAVGDRKVDDSRRALSYRPLREVAWTYREAGCVVYNLDLGEKVAR